jgi:hypothetical protein
MKKSTSIRIACEKAQIETIKVLIPYLSTPVVVRDLRGKIILSTPGLDEDNFENARNTHVTIQGNEGEDILTVHLFNFNDGLDQGALKSWQESSHELHQGLSALVKGDRVSLPLPRDDDPLAEVKKTYNAALETVERMISVSRLF